MAQVQGWSTNLLGSVDLFKQVKTVKAFAKNNRSALGTAGLVAVGAALGGIGGVALVKTVAALWGVTTVNGIPFSLGAIGGGGLAYGITRRQTPNALSEQAADAHVADQPDHILAPEEDSHQLQSGGESVAPGSDEPAEAKGINRADLTQISGVGPAYAQRLNAAGVHSLDDLAALTAEQLTAMLAASGGRQSANVQSWIAQAQQLLGNGPDQVRG